MHLEFCRMIDKIKCFSRSMEVEAVVAVTLVIGFFGLILYAKLIKPLIKMGFNSKEIIIGIAGFALSIAFAAVASPRFGYLDMSQGLMVAIFIGMIVSTLVGLYLMKRRRLKRESVPSIENW